MSETTEQNQAVEAQAQAGSVVENTDALDRIRKLEQNNAKLLDEKNAAAKTNQDLQRQLAEQKQAELIEKEDYKGLHADLKTNYEAKCAELDAKSAELERVMVDRQQDQIKLQSLSAISQSGAVNPNQVYALLKQDLRLKDEGVVALSGGIEVPLQQHLESLKQPNTGWEHQFAGSGARGMSATGSTPTTADGRSWGSMSFTEQVALLDSQPELAAQLQAQG